MVRMRDATGTEKMSKSLGNTFLLYAALDAYGRDALIAYFCGGHYRQPIDFDDERMSDAATRVARIREAGRRLVAGPSPTWSGVLREEFFSALAEDFNTPRAMSAVFEWVREANRSDDAVGDADLREMLGVLALENLLDEVVSEAPTQAIELAAERTQARADRDFARADAIRDQLRELGWEVRDGADGPELLPLS
jgi:cysteinyl-tRNA synthetase